jgi:hypothetical protein
MGKLSKYYATLTPSMRKNSIPFVSKVENMGKVDGPDAEKSEWIKLDFLIDPDNTASNYS